jgi:TonB family protein
MTARRMGPGLLCRTLLALCLLGGCGRTPEARRPLPKPVEPGPWFVVDAEADRAVEGQTIYHQGPERPEATHSIRARVRVVPAVAPRVIVEAVITAEGRIARARVLRAPKIERLQEALTESLREWRFRPALLENKPVAVYYTLTVALAVG